MSDADSQAALLRVAVNKLPASVPSAASWGHWYAVAEVERVVPLLYELVDTVPTDLTGEERSAVHRLQRDVMSHCVLLEHHLFHIVDALAEHGIRSAVLKGAASAHLDYPTPSLRQFVDIDLLIDPEDRIAALAVLAREGWAQAYALPRGHEDYTHAVTLARGDVELDLHQRIGHRALGLRIPTAELLERAVPFDIAGSTLFALHDIDRLIHAAVHMVSSRGVNRRLSSVADVLVAASLRRGVAWQVLDQAEGWRVRPLIEHAVLIAHQSAGVQVPTEWLVAMRKPTRQRDRLVERAYLGEQRRPLTEELAHLRLLHHWRDRSRYVAGYLSTDAEYAAQHGRSGTAAQVRYLVSKLRSRE